MAERAAGGAVGQKDAAASPAACADVLARLETLHSLQDLDVLLDVVLRTARELTAADAGSVFLAGEYGLAFSQIQNDSLFSLHEESVEQYRHYVIALDSRSIAGHVALSRRSLALDDVYNIPAGLPCSFNRYFDQESGYRTRSMYSLPLWTSGGELLGVLQLINGRDRQGRTTPFSLRARQRVDLYARHAAAAVERGVLTRELILRMVSLCSLHDPAETGSHVQRVGAMAAEIYQAWARERGEDPSQTLTRKGLLRLAAMLHDMGKVGIPTRILKKPGQLTREEFESMKLHTVYGARLLDRSTSELDRMSRDIALTHHERWDGLGYPGLRTGCDVMAGCGPGLKGEDIPLMARIVAVADVFDALRNRRCYKEPWTEERIREYFSEQAGRQFDPMVVRALFAIPEVIEAIAQRYQEAPFAGGAALTAVSDRNTPEMDDARRLACGSEEEMYRELRHIFRLLAPTYATAFLDLAFFDLRRLFAGQFPGYQASDTPYHDLRHTVSVALALARLLHGMEVETGKKLAPALMETALLGALFHDTGLIRRREEQGEGSGARYMLGHEERSIALLRHYCTLHGRSSREIDDCAQMIRCTDLGVDPRALDFSDSGVRQAGFMLGSADILAQMADRVYLEKIPRLYQEFQEGGVQGYESTVDMYRRTTIFAIQVLERRLSECFDNVSNVMRGHFRVRWGKDSDLYCEAIEKNLKHIGKLNRCCREDSCYRQYLRRRIE